MDKKAVFKLIGFLIVPFLIMVVVIFLLYPKINKEKYEEITNSFDEQVEEQTPFEEPPIPVEGEDETQAVVVRASNTIAEYDSTATYNKLEWDIRERQLVNIIDSLHVTIRNLESELDSLRNLEPIIEEEPELDTAEFAELVKSLLNLEEDELAPILEKMNKNQLIRLYKGGGTLQREKILKSLKPNEAAELMTEIMQ